MKLKYVGPKIGGMPVQFPIGVKSVGQYKKVVVADPYIEMPEKDGKKLIALNAHSGHFVEVNDDNEEVYSTVGSGETEAEEVSDAPHEGAPEEAPYEESGEDFPVDEIVTEPSEETEEPTEEVVPVPKPKRKYTKRKKA